MKRMIALAMALPSVALAQDNQVSYDYIDLDYFRTDYDLGADEIDGTGWAGRFSVGIRNHVYLSGEYRAWDFDGVEGGSTYKRFGFGVHGAIGERFSLYGEAGFKSLDLDLGTGNLEDDPGYIGGGARWYAGDGFELRLGAEFAEAGKGTPPGVGEMAVTFGGDIYMTDVATITIDLTEDDENSTTFTMGMRFYFKKDSDILRQTR
jgi:hypothetical protein